MPSLRLSRHNRPAVSDGGGASMVCATSRAISPEQRIRKDVAVLSHTPNLLDYEANRVDVLSG
jgi:hypothetical protein